MTLYVDAPVHDGWQTHGRTVRSRHMSSEREDHSELRAIAQDRMYRRKKTQ